MRDDETDRLWDIEPAEEPTRERTPEPWEFDPWTPGEILDRIERDGIKDAVLPWDWPIRLMAAGGRYLVDPLNHKPSFRLSPQLELLTIAMTSVILQERPDLEKSIYYWPKRPRGEQMALEV